MTLEKFLLLAHIQTVLSAIIAFLSLIKFKSRNQVVRLIGLVFLASFLANVSSFAFRFIQLRAFVNTPTVVYLIVSFIILSRLYYITLKSVHGRWFVLIAIIFVSFTLINAFFIQKITSNSYSNIFNAMVLLIYCLLYFYVLMRDLPSLYVHHLPMFWFNSALLIFHAGVFFLFAFHSYLINVLKNDMLVYWSFHNILSIVERFIILIGLYYDLKFFQTKGLKSAV